MSLCAIAVLILMGLGAGVWPVIVEAKRRLASEAWRAHSSRVSMAVQLVEVHHPLERCFSCGQKIGVERSGDLMWLRIEGAGARYLHRICADDHGEPLIPRSRPGAPPLA